jgi:hypothetical protein
MLVAIAQRYPACLLQQRTQLDMLVHDVCAGYGTEAVSYIAGLLQSQLVDPRDVWIAQVWSLQGLRRGGTHASCCEQQLDKSLLQYIT